MPLWFISSFGHGCRAKFYVAQFVLLLSIGFFPLGSAFAAPLDEKKLAALIDTALEKWQVPGAAVVIVSGDKILYLKGRGVREIGKPERMTPDTVFPLASCTKAFTTTLLAMLADEGKLDFDDPVRKHLKDFHLSDPLADGDVRLRDLVSHRTGVAGHDLLWYRASWDQDEMIRRVGKLPLNKPFRTAMQYQSIMFTAAGKAAGNAGGKPWETLIEEKIIRPLGMKSTTLRSTDALKNPDHAIGHVPGQNGLDAITWYEMTDPNSAGSLNTSARDLAGWLQLHLNQGKNGDGRLVSAKQLEETHSPQIVIPLGEGDSEYPFTQQMSYGMGWVIQDYRGELLMSHAGLIDGFRAHLAILPKKNFALAILCNRHQTRMNLALSNQIIDQFLEAPAKDWNDHYQKLIEASALAAKNQAEQIERNRKLGTKPSLGIKEYVGTYEEPAYGIARVKAKNGSLFLEWSSFVCPLDHFENDTFRVLDNFLGQWPLEFHIKDGKVTGLTAMEMKFLRK
ncbi:MAG: serine hydrolase [Planctomycetes bacterium]|nr:serine hydrolase [Planctomycetota bacterium]